MNNYNIDDLFSSVNDIYTQFDEGEIPLANARIISKVLQSVYSI